MRVPFPAMLLGLPIGLAEQKQEHVPFGGVHTGQLPKAKRRVEKGEE